MSGPSFYNTIRPMFGGKISQSQVNGIEHILDACSKIDDERWIAYILATVFHETAKTMEPVEESGKGHGYRYGKKVKRSGEVYSTPDHIYYGRGYVQITWYENYQYLGKLIGKDLINHPELALIPDVAAQIMITGMTKGSFTGVSLATYFNEHRADPENARKIINGTDVAERIAGYYNTFYKALTV